MLRGGREVGGHVPFYSSQACFPLNTGPSCSQTQQSLPAAYKAEFNTLVILCPGY